MVPEFQDFFKYCLQYLVGCEEASKEQLKDYCIKAMNLSDEDCHLLTKKGTRTQLDDRLYWTLTYFNQSGLIKSRKEGRNALYSTTEQGQAFYSLHPNGFRKKDLRSIPSFVKFESKKGTHKKEDKSLEEPNNNVHIEEVVAEDVPKKSPIEILEELSTHINETLESTLLDALKKMQPDSFERLIKELLIEMKVSSSKDCIELTQYVKDDGVDIYVYDNVLKMNVICCIQVKRYSETAVGLSTVRELGRNLTGKEL